MRPVRIITEKWHLKNERMRTYSSKHRMSPVQSGHSRSSCKHRMSPVWSRHSRLSMSCGGSLPGSCKNSQSRSLSMWKRANSSRSKDSSALASPLLDLTKMLR
ncbi:hypothetical protein ATANTOWER_000990 [Ataeniobius toweri]|uniref:Uncharacterized protein n=1 Tax=Ataeniobius toweri TaxID=208326 RepID=A0ABU7BYZ6_9TELE|nr:hypothetical protein [Ataeniobius toweri]